jgi:arylsulfatase A-like enzyme
VKWGLVMPARNVVWICADDYTPAACGAYGSRVSRTPSLNRLAADGARFDRAFAAAPLSTPSRQSFFTGRYPRAIGVTLTPTPLPATEITLPARLQAAGYLTAAFGKTHYYAPRPSDWGVRVDRSEYAEWLAAFGGYTEVTGERVLGPWAPFADPARVWLNADVRPFGGLDAEMQGTYYATRAADFLRSRPRQPFFCYVSFEETHSPFRFPADWSHRHTADEFTAPAVTSADAAAVPAVFHDLTDADRRGIAAAYHTCGGLMDKNVGLVLDAVDAAGLSDDTFVRFTSDHGYLLGQHGRFEKHCSYDPAVRACLIVRVPGASGGRTTAALVSLIDLFPTVLEWCGVPVSANVHGRSLLSFLAGTSDTHRHFVVAEYCDNAEIMVRTDRWKWVYSTGTRRRRDGYATPGPLPGITVRLFDLHADPDELHDLSADPRHRWVREELTEVLVKHVRATDRCPELLPTGGGVDDLMQVALWPPEVPRP